MSVASGVTFLVALVGLVLIPRQATRAARIVATRIESRPDTTAVAARRASAVATLARIDSNLVSARRTLAVSLATAPPVPAVDTLPPEIRAERDSLTALLTALEDAMERAAEAPLPPSFRALATTPALRDNAHVRVWLDSLDTVDKLRAPFSALGAGDPIYVALTARVNELGRSIRDAATMERSALRARLAPLVPAPAALPPQVAQQVAQIDTMQWIPARINASREFIRSTHLLDSLRAVNARINTAAERARELSNIGAPPAAMLAAALVIALTVGFVTAFVREMRYPHVANEREAEATTGARILATIQSADVVERSRRKSDVGAPPLIDIISGRYRSLYLHLAATEASIPIVTVTGDIPTIVAAVAANLAAVAAYEARSTLLVDADTATNAVAHILRIRPEPGLYGILAGRVELADAIISTTIGRDRPLDVLPSGHGRMAQAKPEYIERLRQDLTRMERRYDFIVIAAPASYAQLPTMTIIPAPDAVVCARLGDTRIAELNTAVKSLRGVGRYVHGIVLWDDETPRV